MTVMDTQGIVKAYAMHDLIAGWFSKLYFTIHAAIPDCPGRKRVLDQLKEGELYFERFFPPRE